MSALQKSILVAGVLAFTTLGFAAGGAAPGDGAVVCTTPAEVRLHLERSRNGISLTCNDDVRRHNLAREGAGIR